MTTMLDLLEHWLEHGWLRSLDVEFARFLSKEAPLAHPLLILAAALTSHQLGRGHACLDLAATLDDPTFALSLPPEGRQAMEGASALDKPLPLPSEVLAGVDLAGWQLALNHPLLVTDGLGNTPLVCTGYRVYLRRYWQYEQDVRGAITQRLQTLPGYVPDPAVIRTILDVLFAEHGSPAPDWQRLACALAVYSRFSVITGGPGTGKTTTVVTLLALLQALALEHAAHPHAPGRALRIRLAAPTGKAAARLNVSITNAVSQLPLQALAQADTIRASIPVTVTTLHRLLGSRPDSRQFRHDANNPLALDVLVIDEASMVDLEMMAAVLAAVPPAARVILLGDKDQLASVEAGAVLGQLCYRAVTAHYTPATAAWLHNATGHAVPTALLDPQGGVLDQAVVMLRYSHRFSADSGIGQLAHAVNTGDTAAVAAIWAHGHKDLKLVSSAACDSQGFTRLMVDGAVDADAAPASTKLNRHYGYRHYLDVLRLRRPDDDAPMHEFDHWAEQVLAAHGQFQVLCALRGGAWGVEGLNQRIAHVLHQSELISAVDGWYIGRPVLVTRNDYSLGLMNGDIGITLSLPADNEQGWAYRVAFPYAQAERGIKWVLPSRLQAVETVYALTVHKSQGSEFTHTVLVLPETSSPILTRELLYTGITRARNCFTLLSAGPKPVLTSTIQRRVLRVSGLLD